LWVYLGLFKYLKKTISRPPQFHETIPLNQSVEISKECLGTFHLVDNINFTVMANLFLKINHLLYLYTKTCIFLYEYEVE
jgi:hypothetical protein